MRTMPIAAAALALLSTAAFAQTSPMHSPHMGPVGTAPAAMHRAPAPNPLTQAAVSKINGTDVYGSGGKAIGEVSDVLMNPQSKKIDRLVVAEGGVFGIGSHHVAIPVAKFSWDSAKGAFALPMTTAQLKKMPEWKAGGTATAVGSSMPPQPKVGPGAGGSH
jgi:sporulation protein YlmC with PRC-barrel domain